MTAVTKNLIPVTPTHVKPESAPRARVRHMRTILRLSASFVPSLHRRLNLRSHLYRRSASKSTSTRLVLGGTRSRYKGGGMEISREHEPRILRLSEFRDERAGVENRPRSNERVCVWRLASAGFVLNAFAFVLRTTRSVGWS